MENSKPFYTSKTFWASALVALVPLIPGVGPVASAWIAANPDTFAAVLGAVFGGLRLVTDGAVTVK